MEQDLSSSMRYLINPVLFLPTLEMSILFQIEGHRERRYLKKSLGKKFCESWRAR